MVALGPPAPWFTAGDARAPFPIDVAPPPATSGAPAPVPGATLRVTTFNVEFSTRAGALIDALRSHPELRRSDVFLLQEIEPHPKDGARAALVADALGMGHVYAHGLAILCRWPLRDAAVMELPVARLPYNRRRRIALAASLELAGGPVRLVDVHLDTRLDAGERVRQLAPAVDDGHELHIVGGDVNTLPFRFARGVLPIGRADQAAHLDEHMRARGFAAPVRAAGATHRNVIRPRLDALFTRGFAPAAARVAREVRVSDHFPVWVDLSARGGRRSDRAPSPSPTP